MTRTSKINSLNVKPSGFNIFFDGELKCTVFKQEQEILFNDSMTYEELIVVYSAIRDIMERECEMTFVLKQP